MSLTLVALALVLLGALRDEARSRTRLLLGALLVGLAAASLSFIPGDDRLAGLATSAVGEDGIVFLQVVAGLLVLGFLLAWSAGPGLLLGILTAAVALAARSLFGLAGVLRPVGVAAALLAVLVFGWLVIERLRPGRVLVALDGLILDRGDPTGGSRVTGGRLTPPMLATIAAGAIAVAVPHLATVLGGATIATITAWLAARRRGRTAWALPLAALLLAAALLWMLRLSGPLGGWIPDLVDGPFSPRVAQDLGLMVAIAAAVLAGLWPFHGGAVPVLLAPVAGAVAGWVGVLLLPDGLQWWQPVLAPVTLIAMAHGIATRRGAPLLAYAGMYGFWTATSAGAIGGAILVCVAVLVVILPAIWSESLQRAPAELVRCAWLVPAMGAALVLRGGIATQTFYSVVGAVLGALALIIFVPPVGAGSTAPVARAPGATHI